MRKHFSVKPLFEGLEHVYFWTFTFPDVPPIPEAGQRWRRVVQWLQREFGETVWGLRVYELHETHGLHLHALVNKYLPVRRVRAAVEGYGFGRIHVTRIPVGMADYPAKYLGKQNRDDCLKGKRLWAAFGKKDHTRVKDVEVDSTTTRAIRFCQTELNTAKLPFLFVQALFRRPTDDPATLRLACSVLKKSGPDLKELRRVLG